LSRGIKLLETAGFIEVNPAAGYTPEMKDITKLVYNIEVVPQTANTLPQTLKQALLDVGGAPGQGEPPEPNVLNRIARAERLEPASLNWPARTCSPAPDPSEPVSAHPALLYPCPRT